MKSLQGQLLVAAPQLLDPNFLRTVVLMLQHSDEGALGLVLNRPSSTSVSEAWKQARDTECLHDNSLYIGGPCQGPLMAIHTNENLMDVDVAPGVYCSASPEYLEQLVASEEGTIRFVIGSAGWGPGQLEEEIKTGSWLTHKASADHVFYADDDLWDLVRNAIGNATLVDTLGIKHVPKDPSLN